MINIFEDIFKTGFESKLLEVNADLTNYFNNGSIPAQPDELIPKKLLQLRSDKFNQETIDFYNKAETLVGIDLPKMFSNGNDKRIMIVALDPLRRYHGGKNNVTISLIFGLQHPNRRKMNSYWGLIHELNESGYDVYATDLYKIWMTDRTGRWKYTFNQDVFKDVLLQEIAAVNPERIITFGNDARDIISPIHDTSPIAHFSGSARSRWKWVFENEVPNKPRCTNENKITYILNRLVTDGVQLSKTVRAYT